MADLPPDESMDVELFIEEIKSLPAIWNPNSEEYHDRNKKKDAWDQICRKFSDNFEEMNAAGSSANRIRLIKKWCSIKDYYLKKKTRQGQPVEKGKAYVYAPQLSFLSQICSDSEDSSKADSCQLDKKQTAQNKTKNVAFDVDFPLSIEALVDEVKKYPEIWNMSAEGYHEKSKKKKAWANVCRKFFVRYDQISEQDKAYVYHRLINKWRNVKDNYIKSVKRRAKSALSAEESRPYIYARNLSFLHQPGGPIDPQPFVKLEELDSSQDQEDSYHAYEPETVSEYDPSTCESSVSDQVVKRKRESEQMQQIYVPTVPVSCQTIASQPDFNADRMFFESILPSIRDFTEDQKLEFRTEILGVVKKFRRQ